MGDELDKATGLKKSQKVMIKESWSTFEKDIRKNGMDLFMKFFTMKPEAQALFPQLVGKSLQELRTDKHMKAHALVFCRMISNFVDNLNDAEMLVALIMKIIQSHKRFDLTPKDYVDLSLVFHAFMKEKLPAVYNKNVEEAWGIVFQVIVGLAKEYESN